MIKRRQKPLGAAGWICTAALFAAAFGACLNPRPDDLPGAHGNSATAPAGTEDQNAPSPPTFSEPTDEGQGANPTPPQEPGTASPAASGSAETGNPGDAGPDSDAGTDAD